MGNGAQENFLGWWKCPVSWYTLVNWMLNLLSIHFTVYKLYLNLKNTLKNFSEKVFIGFTKWPRKFLIPKKKSFSEIILFPLSVSFECPLSVSCFCGSFPFLWMCSHFLKMNLRQVRKEKEQLWKKYFAWLIDHSLLARNCDPPDVVIYLLWL